MHAPREQERESQGLSRVRCTEFSGFVAPLIRSSATRRSQWGGVELALTIPIHRRSGPTEIFIRQVYEPTDEN